ncbi:MAG: lamin tail domain-containing protein [Candidatus Thermoplasmatota archaeon]|nr:lamin tail domain-containing protein [Candidatus Thermoplasmatota archaeon]
MYKKSVIKKIGSIVVIAAMISSVFAVMSVENASGTSAADVSINEFLPDPTETPESYYEFIELYNGGDISVNLTGWTLEDEVGSTTTYTITGMINPGEFRLFWRNETDITLNNNEEGIWLNSTEDVIDHFDTSTITEGKSWARIPDGTGEWQEAVPTPGTTNGGGDTTDPVTTLTLDPAEYPVWGWYVTNVTVTLDATDDDSGVNYTKYKIGEGDWMDYTQPFVVENDGNNTVEYYSVDIAGNQEEHKFAYVKIANLSSDLEVTPTSANWNETKTIDVHNVQGSASLYDPDGIQVEGPSTYEYTRWPNVLLDKSGDWWVVDMLTDGCNAEKITVNPVSLDVNVTPDSIDFEKNTYLDIEGDVTLDGQAATEATVKLTRSDGSEVTTSVGTDGSFSFSVYLSSQAYGAGEYNITAFIGAEESPDAFGYDTVMVNTIAPNITLVSNDAVGGFDIGKVIFKIIDGGSGLLINNNYNLSIYKGNELYAWTNKTGTDNQSKVKFTPYGDNLNLTSDMWEAGDYTLKVKVDVNEDGNWEYVGEKDYTIISAPDVNLKVLSPEDKKLDVLNPTENKQVIQIQIFGKNMTVYGTPDALNISEDNDVTNCIKVEGDILYSPTNEGYKHIDNGIWNITVFPTRGNGEIYINVTWPDKGTAKETIDIEEGGYATVIPVSVIVDTPTDVGVEVWEKSEEYQIFNANVTLVYENDLYGIGSPLASTETVISGTYTFDNLTSTRAATNIIVIANFSYVGTKYAYAVMRSQPAHDLEATISPANILAGESTTFDINVTNASGAYGGQLYFYLLNETNLAKFHADPSMIESLATNITNLVGNAVSTGNYTFERVETKLGTHYLYVTTKDYKHDVASGSEPSFEVTKATVTVNPSMLVKNVDKNITLVFTVEWNGEPVNGTLKAKGVKEVASYEAYADGKEVNITITNGEGNITNVTAVTIGNITFEFKPKADGSRYAEANGELKVVTPTIDVEPETVFLAEENLITLTVKHPLTNQPCPGLEVSGNFPSGNMVLGKTDENGKVTIGIVPSITGTIKLYVEGDVAGEIEIRIGLKIQVPSGIEEDKEITITVTTRGGKAVEGATVKFGNETAGITDSNGEVKYKPTEKGDFTITAEKSGYYEATKTVTVEGGPTPGFGVIGVILGALAAILIIRRRKH